MNECLQTIYVSVNPQLFGYESDTLPLFTIAYPLLSV